MNKVIPVVVVAGIIVAVAIFAIFFDNVEERITSGVQPTPKPQQIPKPESASEPKTESTSESELTSTAPPIQLSPEPIPDLNCLGDAQCYVGTVTKIIDGDTIKVDGQSVRFALSSASEMREFGGIDSRNFIETICPVGSLAIVDEDDGQILGSYGRLVGKVTCNNVNLNAELLDAGIGYMESRFCDSSEFSVEPWAIKHGCDASTVETAPEILPIENTCNESYPDFCIPSPPPDLDCGDIPQKKFTVLMPDPHRFDGNNDGIGCE